MSLFQIIAALITVTALFSYLNHRLLHLPSAIGLMLIGLLFSVALMAVGHLEPSVRDLGGRLIGQVDFDQTLMQGMLCVLLFAGSLQIDPAELAKHKRVITALSIGGVIISTFIFGPLMYLGFSLVHLPVSMGWCLLFGALISPTDPIAVIEILKTLKLSKTLEIQIAAESLFNDGIGVVLFTVTYEAVISGKSASFGHASALFAQQALGGAAFGLAIGWIAYRLLKSVDAYVVEVLLTLGLVFGGYAAAAALHVSGPIAIVVAGILIGNHGRRFAMSAKTREHVDLFWALNDEILNAVLFVLMGLQLQTLTFDRPLLIAGAIGIIGILIARAISVVIPLFLSGVWSERPRGAIAIMTWGGLRGGISIAMALSLPLGRERDIIVTTTYLIVVFSVLVQGLTIKRVAKSRLEPIV